MLKNTKRLQDIEEDINELKINFELLKAEIKTMRVISPINAESKVISPLSAESNTNPNF